MDIKNLPITKILYKQDQIQKKILSAAKWIDKNFKDKEPILVAILKGAFVFYGQLIPKIKTQVFLDFMVVKTTRDDQSMEPKIIIDMATNIKNRHVIIIEDIIDTGVTLFKLKNLLLKRKPASLSIVTFADKPQARKYPIKSDFNCVKVPNKFVIGYGFDYNEKYRNLPFVGVLDLKKVKK